MSTVASFRGRAAEAFYPLVFVFTVYTAKHYRYTVSVRDIYGLVYNNIVYDGIRIPRISGNFDACADSVYQALFPRKKGSLGLRGKRAWGRG